MQEGVCPVWVGYLLASPIRRFFQNPQKILAPFVGKGMTVLDVGCAMGFFSLPSAEMVGSSGRVVCVDVQEKMIRSLEMRAVRAGLSNRIEARVCFSGSLGLHDLTGTVDFALASAVVHEMIDPAPLFSEICESLKPGGKFLVMEPKMHVSEKDFETSVALAEKNGFRAVDRPKAFGSRTVLFEKKTG